MLTVSSLLAYEMSREPLNWFAPNSQGRRACLVPRSDDSECQGQGQGHQGQRRHFSALSAACVRFMFGKTSLAFSCKFCFTFSCYRFNERVAKAYSWTLAHHHRSCYHNLFDRLLPLLPCLPAVRQTSRKRSVFIYVYLPISLVVQVQQSAWCVCVCLVCLDSYFRTTRKWLLTQIPELSWYYLLGYCRRLRSTFKVTEGKILLKRSVRPRVRAF